jgi:hypothetical protein
MRAIDKAKLHVAYYAWSELNRKANITLFVSVDTILARLEASFILTFRQ